MKLTQQFLDQQKENLLKEKERLEKRIELLDKYPEYGDLQDDSEMELRDYENNRSIEDQLQLLLKKVDSALKAIENGTYGQCQKCRVAIETGRLKIMPYADLCVTCKKNAKK
jgi:DnaK suppressor protein